MARSKSKGGRKVEAGKPTGANFCPSCGAAATAGANFCQSCGASLEGGAARKPRDTASIVLFSIMGIAITVAVGGIVYVASESDVAPAPAAFKGPATPTGQPPDLSGMSPREAADRLFNRIMTADQQGDKQEALRFVPMALQAYERLSILDADAQFHIGLIHSVAGDLPNLRKRAETLKQFSPTHLLAFILEHDAAEQSGDKDAAAKASAAFVAAYKTEIDSARPEYQAHEISITKFYARASGGGAAAGTPVAGEVTGAALFAVKCAMCHGPNAEGSDQGPPLVHKIYEPSHHGDDSFYRAVREGVRGHHWKFGNMPPVPGISDAGIARIVAHVRALQVAKGIR